MKLENFKGNRQTNTNKINANPKINILMSENIAQARLIFCLEYFHALYYHHLQPKKFKTSSK